MAARKIISGLAVAAVLVAGGATGWHAWTHRPQGEPQAVEFADATIGPGLTGAEVLGLGEATHGTHEFQVARIELLDRLAGQGFTTITLEADYAGVRQANEWINGGAGSVTDAVTALGFAIYRTEENADLLTWMRDYNTSHPDRPLQLAGFDAQRMDTAKAQLVDLVAGTDQGLATRIETALAGYDDDWSMSATDDEFTACAGVAHGIVEQVSALPLSADQDTAVMLATQIEQNCVMRGAGQAYGRTRDAYMFTNLRWLVERAPDRVIVLAHNGHLDKTAASFGSDPEYRSMGELAAAHWGSDYKVIATDFVHAEVIARGTDGFRSFEFTNRTPLRGMFAGTRMGYLEFDQASPTNRELLARTTQMGAVGESVQPLPSWLPMLSQVRVVPSAAYDALILVQNATPVTMLA